MRIKDSKYRDNTERTNFRTTLRSIFVVLGQKMIFKIYSLNLSKTCQQFVSLIKKNYMLFVDNEFYFF